jgi:hypothetical protein
MSATRGPGPKPGPSTGNGSGKPAARSRLPLLLILLFGAVLLVGGGAWVWLSGQTGAGAGAAPAVVTSPKLAVDRTEIDFGPVKVNKMVKATFKVANEGGKPLQIVGTPRVEVAKGC